jgi:hypothetical protein
LFGCYNDFHGWLFTDQSTTLNKLIVDAGMSGTDNKTNVGGIVLSVFEGFFIRFWRQYRERAKASMPLRCWET